MSTADLFSMQGNITELAWYLKKIKEAERLHNIKTYFKQLFMN